MGRTARGEAPSGRAEGTEDGMARAGVEGSSAPPGFELESDPASGAMDDYQLEVSGSPGTRGVRTTNKDHTNVAIRPVRPPPPGRDLQDLAFGQTEAAADRV